jgi:hypothetical protein
MIVSACCLTGFSVAEAADPIVKQLFPASGTGGPYVIAVLSDGFADNDAEHHEFDAAANWVFNIQLFNDDFYQAHKASFTVKTIFRPASQSGATQYGISASGGINNCYITYATTPEDADTNVEGAVAFLKPTRTVIIAKGVTSGGCTHNLWTYVWTGIEETSGVLEHELGHLIANLLDEYSLNALDYPNVDPYPPVNGPNCSTFLTPSWSTLVVPVGTPSPGRVEGCNYYSFKIWRPYATCRMNTLDEKFCALCGSEVSLALQELSSAVPSTPTALGIIPAAFFQRPQLPPRPERAVRMLVEIHSQSQQVKVLKATEVNGPTIVRQRLIGTHAYEIRDGDNFTTGVLAGNPFESRAYDGRGAGHPVPIQGESATVVIEVPRTTIQNLLTRGVEVTFYKLDATQTRENITHARLSLLKQENLAHSIGALTPNDMSKYLQQLTQAPR